MKISDQDRKRISAAIRAAESKTSGEIVCVLAERSSDPTALPIFVAAAIALALPWVLAAATAMPVFRMLTLQVVTFVLVAGLLAVPRLRAALAPRAARRAMAHRAAMHQFALRGVANTAERTGIMIYVSIADRYARIIADAGIAARVPQSEWQSAIDALIAHMRDGRIADGFVTAIERCGEALARHFPRTATNVDELPDRIHLV